MILILLITFSTSASAKMIPFIVGGREASIADWPFIAFISVTGYGVTAGCGSSLISSQTILTAAHCVDDILGGRRERFLGFEFWVFMGHEQVLHSTMKRRVIDYQSHEKYDITGGRFDISIMFLARPVKFADTVVKAILVPREDFRPVEESSQRHLLVAGWGAVTKDDSDVREKEQKPLKSLGQVMFTTERCNQFMKDLEIIDGVICAGRVNASHFAYSGDSGGPLVRISDRYQVGLVSIRLEVYGITLYTSVPHYYAWIDGTQRYLFDKNCAAERGCVCDCKCPEPYARFTRA